MGKQISLQSSNHVFAPGLFKWCQNAWRSPLDADRAVALKVLADTYSLDGSLAESLLEGHIPVETEGELLRFTVPDAATPESEVGDGTGDAEGSQFYLLVILGDVEPYLQGPFDEPRLRDRAAIQYRRGDPDRNDGLYRLDVSACGIPVIAPFGAAELHGGQV